MTKRVAAYLRVSTDQQADTGVSLAAQEAKIRKHVAFHDWTLVEPLYIDGGFSGKLDSRPALDRLRADAKAGKLDVVMATKLDRLGRSTLSVLELIKELDGHGVKIALTDSQIDTTTSHGKMMLTLIAAFAELERDLIAERVAAVSATRAEQGKMHGRPPYGYAASDVKGIPNIVEERADVVRHIFDLADSGVSQRQIARRLNFPEDGSAPVPSHTGKQWTQAAVANVLKNVAYKGKVELLGTVYDGLHEAIVDAAQWDRVNRDLVRRVRTKTTAGRPVAGAHLMVRGLLRCQHCDSPMLPRKSADTYECFGRKQHGPGFCEQTPIPRKILDEAMFAQFESRALDLDAMKDELVRRATANLASAESAVRAAKVQVKATEDAYDRVYRDYVQGAGGMTRADWELERPALADARDAARANLAQAEEYVSKLKEATEAGTDAAAAALDTVLQVKADMVTAVGSTASIEAARLALSRVFDAVYVKRDEPVKFDSDEERALVEANRAAAAADLGTEPHTAGKWTMTPLPSEDAFLGLDDEWRPVFARQTLAPAGAGADGANNANVGLTR